MTTSSATSTSPRLPSAPNETQSVNAPTGRIRTRRPRLTSPISDGHAKANVINRLAAELLTLPHQGLHAFKGALAGRMRHSGLTDLAAQGRSAAELQTKSRHRHLAALGIYLRLGEENSARITAENDEHHRRDRR